MEYLVTLSIPLAHAFLAFVQGLAPSISQYAHIEEIEIPDIKGGPLKDILETNFDTSTLRDFLRIALCITRGLRVLGMLPFPLYVFAILLSITKNAFEVALNIEYAIAILCIAAVVFQISYIFFKIRYRFAIVLINLHPNYTKQPPLAVVCDIVPLWKKK